MNRRHFLQTTSAFAADIFPQVEASAQFTTGLVPAGKTSVENGLHDFWSHCDEIAALGVHQIEFNNTRAKVAEAYASRAAEFREATARRKLRLAGVAQFSHMDSREALQATLRQHLLLAEFLSSNGGKFITHMIAPGEVLNEAEDEAAYLRIDVQHWAENANEVGRQVYEQWGVKLAYHPEQREVSTGVFRRFLQSSDERYVHFVADVGHLAAGGADPVQVCRTYRNRLVAVHLKDFTPSPVEGIPVKAGNVPFGRGVVDLPGVVAELRRIRFAGWVMGESGGSNQEMYAYMAQTLALKF